jgi:RHS repeat-associated protein
LTPVIYSNAQVSAVFPFRYDARYRLIAAQGREQVSQAAFNGSPGDGNYRDYPFVGAVALGDPLAQRSYTERYTYDAAGNLTHLAHQAGGGGWTRDYTYAEPSLLEPARMSNRLSSTSAGATEPYQYDPHGSITRMPHLPVMQWSFKQELFAASRQVASSPQMTYFAYDCDGRRMRKVTERQNGTRAAERIYLPGWELYREYASDGTTVTLTRESLHVHDGGRRVAIVETDTDTSGAALATAVRYQIGNQLTSTCLELDEHAALVSYEEYSPFGSSVFQAGGAADVSRKRYRYTSRERDSETGFAMHGVRYYMPWLGRWASCDPAGFVPAGNATYDVSCKQLDEDSRKNRFSCDVPRWNAQDPIGWQRPRPTQEQARRPVVESSQSWNLYVYAEDNPNVFTDLGGREPAEPFPPVNIDKKETALLLAALAIVVVGAALTGIYMYFKHGNFGLWAAAVSVGLIAIFAVAMIFLAIESKQKIVDQNRITAPQEARIFDLWAFFHYLVPALVGTGVTLIAYKANKNLSGTWLMIIGTSSTLVVATGWELAERHLGAGLGEYPSNIVGDVVIGTIGGAIASTAFVFAMGKKVPAGAIIASGAGFAVLGFALTSALIWYGAIRPAAGIDTWPDHRIRMAPDPINTNVA